MNEISLGSKITETTHNYRLDGIEITKITHWYKMSVKGRPNLIPQLEENIDSIHVELSEDLLAKINAIHSRMPNPAP